MTRHIWSDTLTKAMISLRLRLREKVALDGWSIQQHYTLAERLLGVWQAMKKGARAHMSKAGEELVELELVPAKREGVC